jgi:uncharacterized protein (TIRG00374 family)
MYLNRSLRRLSSNSQETTTKFYSIQIFEWIWILILSTVSQFLHYLAIYLLMLALGLFLPLGLALAIIISVTLISMLPVSPSGIGTRDMALIFWFQIINISLEQALALSVLMLVLYLVWRLAGLIVYLFNPLDFEKLTTSSSALLN